MVDDAKKTEGFVPVKGGKIWYKKVGEGKGIPLIVVNGGPGAAHDYMEPIEDLAKNRPVIFYDQLGCGNSDWPTNKSLWTVNRFTSEIDALTKKLKLKRYHLLGHSWGPVIAVSHALKRPKGLVSLILSDTYLSTSRWQKDSDRLKAAHDVLRAYKIHPTIYKPYRDRAIIALIENGSDIQAAEAAELFYVTADEFRAMAYIGVAIRNKKKIQKD